jgi:hypothetical protein
MDSGRAQAILELLIRDGMALSEVRNVAVVSGIELENAIDENGILRGVIRGRRGLINPIVQSIYIEIQLDKSQRVVDVKCKEVFTGP